MPAIRVCDQCESAYWADRPHSCGTEHDRLQEQFQAMKATQRGKELAGAFMQGFSRAKLHTDSLEDAFRSWRICLEPDATSVDFMLRKLRQIRNLALSIEGHSFDLIVALAEEALAAGIGESA